MFLERHGGRPARGGPLGFQRPHAEPRACRATLTAKEGKSRATRKILRVVQSYFRKRHGNLSAAVRCDDPEKCLGFGAACCLRACRVFPWPPSAVQLPAR